MDRRRGRTSRGKDVKCWNGAESDERGGDGAGEGRGGVVKQRRAETAAGVGAEDYEVLLPELCAWLRYVPG